MSFELSQTASIDAPATAGAHNTIDIAFITDAAEWNGLVARAPLAHLPQSFAYGEGKRAKGWTIKRASFRAGGRVVAFATVLERRVAGVRIVARVNRGPVFLEANPDAATVIAVYGALRRTWRGPLLIAPALQVGDESSAQLRAAGFRQRQPHGWLSGRILLEGDEAEQWAALTSGFRNRARKAVKAGATLRIGEDDATYGWMLERHAENMRNKGFSAADATLLQALRDAAPAAVSVFQLLHQGQPVAGMSVVRFGRRAEYHIGWFGEAGRELNAGNFLMWEIIKELRHRGVEEFDVGGMRAGDGYTRFKRTMNPVEYQLAGEWWAV